ncbi:MAG: hypothetical protein OXU96_00580 [Gammaproteobacteria bacterium]|nr:hypothetical protein [Gammaproteobacteria bacterium]
MTGARILMIIAMFALYLWMPAPERIPEAVALGFGAGTLLLVNPVVLLSGALIDVSPATLLLTPALRQ